MATAPLEADAPMISAVLRRVFDSSRRYDYLLLFLFASVPIAWAWMINIHTDIIDKPSNTTMRGYWNSYNWSGLSLILPSALFLGRRVFQRITPVASPSPGARQPPLVNLAHSEVARKRVYDSLRCAILAPLNLWITLAATLLINVLDSWSFFQAYFGEPIVVADLSTASRDWAFMWAIAEAEPSRTLPSPAMTLIFMLYTYLMQSIAIFLGLTFTLLLARHNLFFLSHVYQRRAVRPGHEDEFYEIDIYDANRCFGFRKANDAFNTQVIFLMLGGLLMLVSRFGNLSAQDPLAYLRQLRTDHPDADFWTQAACFFPTTGQALLTASWLLAFGIVMLPSLVKLLPRLPRPGCPFAPMTITGYLREYIPDDRWPFDPNQEPKDTALRALAGQFARNAFWPTGNNRASQLFQFAFLVCLLMLFPAPASNVAYFVLYLLLLGAAAYALKTGFFALLNWCLAYIDPALVTPLPGGNDEFLPRRRYGRLGCKVFINYRRSDSKAYAGHLHRTLLEHLGQDQIFMDIEDIEPGEMFSTAISTTLDEIDALIVLIGPTWLDVADGEGRRRLDAPGDFVRDEISHALKHRIRVFPLLVGGATMPPAGFLPPTIANLSLINAIEVTDERWDYDVGRLIEALQKLRRKASGG